jgi:hypothetical protein
MADTTDSKSVIRKYVGVQVPPPALLLTSEEGLIRTRHTHTNLVARRCHCRWICSSSAWVAAHEAPVVKAADPLSRLRNIEWVWKVFREGPLLLTGSARLLPQASSFQAILRPLTLSAVPLALDA